MFLQAQTQWLGQDQGQGSQGDRQRHAFQTLLPAASGAEHGERACQPSQRARSGEICTTIRVYRQASFSPSQADQRFLYRLLYLLSLQFPYQPESSCI
jgi:hypothetical protein